MYSCSRCGLAALVLRLADGQIRVVRGCQCTGPISANATSALAGAGGVRT